MGRRKFLIVLALLSGVSSADAEVSVYTSFDKARRIFIDPNQKELQEAILAGVAHVKKVGGRFEDALSDFLRRGIATAPGAENINDALFRDGAYRYLPEVLGQGAATAPERALLGHLVAGAMQHDSAVLDVTQGTNSHTLLRVGNKILDPTGGWFPRPAPIRPLKAMGAIRQAYTFHFTHLPAGLLRRAILKNLAAEFGAIRRAGRWVWIARGASVHGFGPGLIDVYLTLKDPERAEEEFLEGMESPYYLQRIWTFITRAGTALPAREVRLLGMATKPPPT